MSQMNILISIAITITTSIVAITSVTTLSITITIATIQLGSASGVHEGSGWDVAIRVGMDERSPTLVHKYELQSKLLKGGYMGDYIRDYYRVYRGRY